MEDRKRKRAPAKPKPEKRVISAPGAIPTTRLVTITGKSKMSVEQKLVGAASRPPAPVSTPTDTLQPQEAENATPVDSEPETPMTQTAKLMAEYMGKFPDILRLWIAHKSGAGVGTSCYCGEGVRSSQCRDCFQYELSCEACWIKNHQNNPFHWAYIWNPELRFFVKHDISLLDGGSHIPTLGHYGKPCPNTSGNSVKMTIVEPNGVHATKLYFCGCAANPSIDSQFDQLMEAGFFPGSVKAPRTGFSFEIMRRFHLAGLESKTAALDFISCLRRLTDNATTAKVPDPYPAFLPAIRTYRYLKSVVRLGQAHGIDQLTPYRNKGSLLVKCVLCPEVGVNVSLDLPKPPLHLRHTLQQQMTLDGNFHTGHFAKNCDPRDVSLFDGKAHFAPDKEYRAYLQSIPVSKEKSTCTYLKAVNRQDKKKFKHQDVTGTINGQCSHVFVVATVDMYHSERFANTDAALARMVRKMGPDQLTDIKFRLAFDNIDKVATYDIACEYYAKLKERFRACPDLLDVADIIDRIRWGIPALHVTGHKSDCMYMFGTAYMDCVGHFHGETAEAYWPSANKLGGHARQANNGHRQDMLIDNANDWNWKKIVNIHVSLYDDLLSATKLFREKRTHFIGLSVSHREKLPEWQALLRPPEKVPSQKAIYDHMITNLENFETTEIPTNEVACFLKEGIKIQANQRKIVDALVKDAEHDLQGTKKEIATRRSKLTTELTKWRDVRDSIMTMPDVTELMGAPQVCEVECEKLWLPSDFTPEQRVALGSTMIALAEEEGKLREGEAYDLIRKLQTACKGLSALEDRKRLEKGQKSATAAGEQVLDARRRRDELIKAYNSVRQAMISLGTLLESTDPANDQFPVLTVKDTFMKSRRRERALGDSRRGDGMLYTRTGITAGSKISNAPAPDEGDGEDSEQELEEPEPKRSRPNTGGSVQMSTRTKRTPAQKRAEKDLNRTDPNPANKNGWLWELRRPSNMTDTEMRDWETEGDRVQWARAEGEMDRFQEQVEIKLAEFLRCLAAFDFNTRAWNHLGGMPDQKPGYAERANETAHMWARLTEQCREHLISAGFKFALEPDFNLVSYLEGEREKSDQCLRERGIIPRDKRAEAVLFAAARGEIKLPAAK
ncbi:hypothetical protein B0H16DRAFT_1744912 [Mycena metata]|uniref:CxC2-like cysteine cluster KDZ transposase-associated domain-containing protein n=1 Tax=Mycena metata TaxID=1033252 RepID=A0AAD7MD31_9AGAR|nr:hypothetical protein B0H16DRAFT_1744912 [Mycena metata]